jgi:hypothetical protein
MAAYNYLIIMTAVGERTYGIDGVTSRLFARYKSMALDCTINGCGILAIGRCVTCGQPFCQSHQARAPLPGPAFVNLCSPCKANRDAEEYVKSGQADQLYVRTAAAGELTAASLLAVEMHTIFRYLDKKPFHRARWVDQVQGRTRGWLIGDMTWNRINRDGLSLGDTAQCLTALLADRGNRSIPLIPVTKDPARDGYLIQSGYGTIKEDWKTIAAAIRRLAGTTP